MSPSECQLCAQKCSPVTAFSLWKKLWHSLTQPKEKLCHPHLCTGNIHGVLGHLGWCSREWCAGLLWAEKWTGVKRKVYLISVATLISSILWRCLSPSIPQAGENSFCTWCYSGVMRKPGLQHVPICTYCFNFIWYAGIISVLKVRIGKITSSNNLVFPASIVFS